VNVNVHDSEDSPRSRRRPALGSVARAGEDGSSNSRPAVKSGHREFVIQVVGGLLDSGALTLEEAEAIAYEAGVWAGLCL
jgi:hypothetical protein